MKKKIASAESSNAEEKKSTSQNPGVENTPIQFRVPKACEARFREMSKRVPKAHILREALNAYLFGTTSPLASLDGQSALALANLSSKCGKSISDVMLAILVAILPPLNKLRISDSESISRIQETLNALGEVLEQIHPLDRHKLRVIQGLAEQLKHPTLPFEDEPE